MIGSAEMKFPIGISPRRRKPKRSQSSAIRKPASEPMIQPGMTARITVCTKSAPRVGSEPISRAPIIEGGGRSTVGTFRPTQITSHRKSSVKPNRKGMPMPPARASAVGARSGTALQSWFASQSSSHAVSAASQSRMPPVPCASTIARKAAPMPARPVSRICEGVPAGALMVGPPSP